MSCPSGLSGLLMVGVLLAVGFVTAQFTRPPAAPATPLATQSPPIAPANAPTTVREVEPGQVHWHASAEAALAAAKVSHKPVLVFHMMGRLDHRFC